MVHPYVLPDAALATLARPVGPVGGTVSPPRLESRQRVAMTSRRLWACLVSSSHGVPPFSCETMVPEPSQRPRRQRRRQPDRGRSARGTCSKCSAPSRRRHSRGSVWLSPLPVGPAGAPGRTPRWPRHTDSLASTVLPSTLSGLPQPAAQPHLLAHSLPRSLAVRHLPGYATAPPPAPHRYLYPFCWWVQVPTAMGTSTYCHRYYHLSLPPRRPGGHDVRPAPIGAPPARGPAHTAPAPPWNPDPASAAGGSGGVPPCAG